MGDTQREARQCTAYLGQKLDGHPAVPEEGVGEGSVDGSTRRAVVQQREELRRAVLKVGLSRLSDPTLKPVVAWANRDKLSTSWPQCLPGPNGLSSQGLTEAMALHLCVPSPACTNRVGARVGQRTGDILGDNIMAEVLPGDRRRITHDKVKMALHSLCIWARLPVTVGVWGIFNHLIPADNDDNEVAMGDGDHGVQQAGSDEADLPTGSAVDAEFWKQCNERCCNVHYKYRLHTSLMGKREVVPLAKDTEGLSMDTLFTLEENQTSDEVGSLEGLFNSLSQLGRGCCVWAVGTETGRLRRPVRSS